MEVTEAEIAIAKQAFEQGDVSLEYRLGNVILAMKAKELPLETVERVIEHVSKYDVAEGDSRRRFTQAQMETAIRIASMGDDGLKVGDPVRCLTMNCPEQWRDDWTDWAGFVAGIQFCPKVGALHYTVSDNWPPKGNGDLSDGFYDGQLARTSLGTDGGGL